MRQWSANEVRKVYTALANGLPDWDAITISSPIGPVPHTLLGSIHAATHKGKSALTYVTVINAA